MCKYCDMEAEQEYYNQPPIYRGSSICSAGYFDCYITMEDGTYYIDLIGSPFEKDYSEQISYCPFCGRKLKE